MLESAGILFFIFFHNSNLEQPEESKQHFLFGNILLLQITLMLGKAAAPRMQCACFVTKASRLENVQDWKTSGGNVLV